MDDVAVMTWVAAGYALFLLLAAHGVDRMARRTASQSSRWHSGAFVYHEDHDAWLCPQDQWLWPTSFDPDNRLMRYRASPAVCNSCPVKHSCTGSDHGREVARAVDPWPASEAERFHRGIACAVAVLALAWPLGTALGGVGAADLVVLLSAVAVVAIGSVPLWSHLRRSPAAFPEHVTVERPDEAAASRAVAAARELRRRSGYRSDRAAAGHVGARRTGADRTGAEQAGAELAGADRDRFATRWGAFEESAADEELPGGWSRRGTS